MKTWFNDWLSGKTDITKSILLPDSDAEHPMQEGASYFAVDLQGMSLAEDYTFLTRFSPFLAFILEFGAHETDTLSVVFNPREKLEAVSDSDSVIRPDVRGITLIPERPLRSDKVSMSGGMFREVRNDAGTVLLDTLGRLTQAGLHIPGAGHLKVAEIAYAGLRSLLRMESNAGRATIMRGFSASQSDGDQDRLMPGWLLITGEGELAPDEIKVVEGAARPKDARNSKRFDQTDWVLLRIRSEKRRGSYGDLGFDPLWKAYQTALHDQNAALADQEYRALNSAIVTCDLLIEEEKDVLLHDYHLRKLKEIKRLQYLNGGPPPEPLGARRGAEGGKSNEKDVRTLLRTAAIEVENLASVGRSEDRKSVAEALENLSFELSDDKDAQDDDTVTTAHLDKLRGQLGPAINPKLTSAALSALGTFGL